MINLKNKTAIITGASQGIGREIAFNLAENGCETIFIISRNSNSLNNVKKDLLNTFNTNIECVTLDVGQPLEVEKAFKEIIAKSNNVDILVNNAGITKDNIIMRMSIEEWNDVINTNLSGYFYCCKYYMVAFCCFRGLLS